MPFLDMVCEGKHTCTNIVNVSMTKARAMRAASKPYLCEECFQIYGGMTAKQIDNIDPRPKSMPPREIV